MRPPKTPLHPALAAQARLAKSVLKNQIIAVQSFREMTPENPLATLSLAEREATVQTRIAALTELLQASLDEETDNFS